MNKEEQKIKMKIPLIGQQKEIQPDQLMNILSRQEFRIAQVEQAVVNIWNVLTTPAQEPTLTTVKKKERK